MSMRAILEGAVIGLAVAIMFAFAIAIADYQFGLSEGVQTVCIWCAAALTFVGAGWGSGRIAENGAWIHGALAAVTLNLVSILIGETAHIGNVTHLWLGLVVALTSGVAGGIIGAASQ